LLGMSDGAQAAETYIAGYEPAIQERLWRVRDAVLVEVPGGEQHIGRTSRP
jgi:hypothetical protein